MGTRHLHLLTILLIAASQVGAHGQVKPVPWAISETVGTWSLRPASELKDSLLLNEPPCVEVKIVLSNDSLTLSMRESVERRSRSADTVWMTMFSEALENVYVRSDGWTIVESQKYRGPLRVSSFDKSSMAKDSTYSITVLSVVHWVTLTRGELTYGTIETFNVYHGGDEDYYSSRGRHGLLRSVGRRKK